MKKQHILIVLFAGLLLLPACNNDKAYKTLIITGQSNHDWKASSPILKQILDETGLFSTEIIVTPEKGGDMSSFAPDFSKYRLVVMDYVGDPWSDKTKAGFVNYVNNGGGVVIYHESCMAFPQWKEYNEMTGIGGWQGRNEKDGPYFYFRNNKLVTDTAAGIAGSHGKRREFVVRTRLADHPVTRGLPARWIHGSDELYSQLRGPGKNMQILATAFADTMPGGGTRRDEPMLMAVSYGKGRIFSTVMGHADNDGGPAMQCAGFIVTLQRGAEWAVTGEVTQPVPFDFPNNSGVILRSDYNELSLEKAIENFGSYAIGKSTRNLTCLQSHIRNAKGDVQALMNIEKMMNKVLTDANATAESKKLILRELSWMGTSFSTEAIKSLSSDENLKDEALYALERIGK